MAIPTCIAGLDAKILLMSNEASKVVAHDMHPFKPWVVTGHENGNVTLWDYNTQNILISFFVNEIDEGTREQLNILRAAERSPDYKGSKDAEAQLKALEKAKVGAIRSVRFMDKDTQKAAFLLRQRIRRRKQREGGSAPPPAATSASSSQLKEGGSPTVPERRQRRPTLMAADSRKFRKERKQETNLFECQWMLVLTEYRMFMYDYVTQEVKELPSSGLDLKPQLACSPLGIGSMVAITGSDGVMRVFDMEHRKMVSKFPCGKQAEFVFGFDDTNGQKVVVVTSHGGVIQWWVDLETFLGDGTDKPTQQVVHGGEISAMAVNYSECLVITASSDKSVALFDLASARELMRMKPKTKQVYFGLSSLVHPRFPPRAMLVTLKDDSKLMMLHPEEEKNITKDLLDTNEFPNSQKKNKIHGVSVHPIHSNRIACISRMGLCVVSIEQNSIPSVSAVPSSPTFFAGLQNCVEQLTRESGERVHSHPLTGWGAVNVRVNPLGNYLAVWNGAIYQIVDVSKKSAWKVMDEGPALDVVWAGPSMPLRYAFLAPPIAAGDDAKKKKKGRIGQRSSNKSGGTPQHSKALPTVVIKEFDSNNYPRPVTEDASVKFYVNTLFGGPLLGVSMTPDESQMTGRMASRLNSAISCPSPRPTPSPAGGTLRAASARVRHGTVSAAFNKPPPAITTLTPCDTDYLNQCFSFMAWDGTTAVAEDLPVPLNVVWDTNNNYCAMVFETYFCVFEMRPSWRLVVRQEEAMVSGVWHASSVLFYSTDQHLKCIFPGNASAPPVLVASVDPVEAELLSLSHGTKQLIRHLLPSTQYAVLPVAGKSLSVVDTSMTVHEISLASPKLQIQIACASGNPDAAIEFAKEVPPEEHDDIAKVMRAFQLQKVGVKLSGISPALKFEMAIEAQLYEVALPALSAAIDHIADDEAAKRALTKRALDIVAELSQANANADVITGILRRVASKLDSDAYMSLTLHHVKEKDMLALRSLYDSLILEELWELAKFTALFIGDDSLVKSVCTQGSSFADALVFAGPDDADASELATQLDASLEAEQNKYRGVAS